MAHRQQLRDAGTADVIGTALRVFGQDDELVEKYHHILAALDESPTPSFLSRVYRAMNGRGRRPAAALPEKK